MALSASAPAVPVPPVTPAGGTAPAAANSNLSQAKTIASEVSTTSVSGAVTTVITYSDGSTRTVVTSGDGVTLSTSNKDAR